MNTPKHRQQWIFDLLKGKPNLSYSECFAKYSPKFAKTRRTFDKDWNVSTERIKQYQETIEKEVLKESIKEEVEAAKSVIKSKNDRLVIYQNLVDECLKDLSEGMTSDTYITKEGIPKQYRRKMNNLEYNQTRKTLRDIQSEISKIQGDYKIAADTTVNIFVPEDRQSRLEQLKIKLKG